MDIPEKIIGNYRIDRLLAEGSIGLVYQARDLSLERDVAIKVIHDRFARQPKFFERFQREARTAVATDHPGFVKVYDFGQHIDRLYIVMEYIRGANLRRLLDALIEERKWLPLNEAALLVGQLCQALEYVHRHGMLRRDIQPAHLMLKPEPVGELPYRVVLTDLGLAELVDRETDSREATFRGAPAYLSPERALGLESGPRSDVYSLGTLLYELAVGLLPFPIKTIKEAVHFLIKEQPPTPRSLRPDLPGSLERVILKAITKVPNQRYQNPAELGTALAEALSDFKEIPAPDSEREVSLLTKYMESLVIPLQNEPLAPARESGSDHTELRPALITGKPGALPMIRNSIEVLSKGKKPQVFTPKSDALTMGRDKDNQLVILDPEVSRRHIKVTWDGSNYYITDLESKNGTFLGNTRLKPGVPTIWRAAQTVRIGDTALRLIGRPQPADAMGGFGAGRLGAAITPQRLTVEAGESVTVSLTLLNRGREPDHIILSLTGIPDSWVANLPSRLELEPGEQKEIIFSLHVPRTPQSRAGRRSVAIRVTSQPDPTQFVECKLALTIAPYAEFQAELQPEHLRAGETGRLTVANLGNIQETFTVRFTDAAKELAFQPPQLQLRAPEGSSASVEFQAQLRQSRWLGGEKSHAFNAQVSQPRGETQTLRAELHSQALIPIWVPMLIVPLCLLLAGTILFLPSVLFAGPTPAASSTLTATLTPSTTPEPGAPVVNEWCVYPSDKVPTSFTNCDIQTKVLTGTTLVIQWNVSDADEVFIEPFGNQPASGKISYEATGNTTAFTLKASKAGKDIQKRTDIIVVSPTPTLTRTATSTSTATTTPVTPTVTHTASATPTTPAPPSATATTPVTPSTTTTATASSTPTTPAPSASASATMVTGTATSTHTLTPTASQTLTGE